MSDAPMQVRVDGAASTTGWPLDRGLHYGDGLFETMQARDGRVRFESLHRQRLATGLARLGIALDQDATWHEVAAEARQAGNALLKLLVTRGDATARGYAPSGRERPRRLLFRYPAPAPAGLPADVGAVSLTATLGENPLLAGLKHTNRLEQVLGRAQLAGGDAFEGLMASSSGLLISGTMSNVFLSLQGEVLTPRLDRCGIAGVMRSVVLREAPLAGLPVREAQIPFSALGCCEELFVTNVRLGVQPVMSLDGRPLAVSAATRRLQQRVAGLDV